MFSSPIGYGRRALVLRTQIVGSRGRLLEKRMTSQESVAPTFGCQSVQRRGARLSETMEFGANPGALRMMLYVPKQFAAKSALVVVLHGSSQTAEEYADGAGWLTLADRFGFAVLCPEQTRANNANLGFNWFQPSDTARGRGEAASIHQMIQHAIAVHELDAARVYVTGLSAGGAMTAVMLATYPEIFAAGAMIAGLPYGTASNVWEAFAVMLKAHDGPHHELGDKVRAASSNLGPWPCVSIWPRRGRRSNRSKNRRWTILPCLAIGEW